MCFTPVATFAASASLGVIGVATVRRTTHRRQIPIALIPVAFSLQQLVEGFLWIALLRDAAQPIVGALAVGFLFAAFAFWPIVNPLCAYILEPRRSRKAVLLPFVLLGVVVSGYLSWFLLSRPVSASVIGRCIIYDTNVFGPRELVLIYLAATFVPFLLSSSRTIVFLGALNVALCAVAYYFYASEFVSTWCFFAAVVSAFLYLEVTRLPHGPEPESSRSD